MLVTQPHLFRGMGPRLAHPARSSLLKWVGNKGRFAQQIVSYFPSTFGTYFEPFLGSGTILATVAPENGFGSDCFRPLMEIWQTLHDSPEILKRWYSERCRAMMKGDKKAVYEEIKGSYNESPNGADLIFLCRACYGGVVRFRQADGYMSTPCGVHTPISPEAFSRRVDEWHSRTAGTTFAQMDYREAMTRARSGDLIYCDPPYRHSQTILYGAQSFDFGELLEVTGKCKSRGLFVALSIDGTKRSGNFICDLPLPKGLFEREVFVNCGRSMLKRFQMNGRTLESEVVTDRLLLTY